MDNKTKKSIYTSIIILIIMYIISLIYSYNVQITQKKIDEEYIKKNKQIVTQEVKTKNRANDFIEVQKNLNKEMNIYSNIDIQERKEELIGEKFGFIGVAKIIKNPNNELLKNKKEYFALEVTPIDGQVLNIYFMKPKFLKKQNIDEETVKNIETIYNKLLEEDQLVYIVASILKYDYNYLSNNKMNTNIAKGIIIKTLGENKEE